MGWDVADRTSSPSCNSLYPLQSINHSLRYSWIRKINDRVSSQGSPRHVVILSMPQYLRSHLWPGFTMGQCPSHEGRTSLFLPFNSLSPFRYSEIPHYFPNSRFQLCCLLVPFHFLSFPAFPKTVKLPVSRDDINILSRQRGQAKPCRKVPGGRKVQYFILPEVSKQLRTFCGVN